MKDHALKFLRSSKVIINKEQRSIEVYECIQCFKLLLIDKETQKIVTVNGKMGEEIK